jgi:hypothetical protein
MQGQKTDTDINLITHVVDSFFIFGFMNYSFGKIPTILMILYLSILLH